VAWFVFYQNLGEDVMQKRCLLFGFLGVLIIFLGTLRVYLYFRYHVEKKMTVSVKEFSPETYPDNPSTLSRYHGDYSHKQLVLQKHKNADFTLTFLPSNSKSATIHFKHINIARMTPSLPSWVKNSPELTRISLTDRQWNRQQVSFKINDPHIEIVGGDGVEKNKLYQVELAKNCLNAGLWEVLLYSQEHHKKTLLYQGWFTFPLGYYKAIFEKNTGLTYRNKWYYLEHWDDPASTHVDVNQLRRVKHTYPVVLEQDAEEPIALDGEQVNKKKNIMATHDIKKFDDYFNQDIMFSTFVPPGLYQKNTPWHNKYWRIKQPISAVLNSIESPAKPQKKLDELVITYADDKLNKNSESYFYISGFDIKALPHVSKKNYAKGLLFLMGIGTPPLKQAYAVLVKHPPEKNPMFSVFLDEKGGWINHHEAAIDGSILFVDQVESRVLHVYLVSYERHAVVAHYKMMLPDDVRRE
jgi:hypothetical protein